MSTTTKTNIVNFGAKGQVVIPRHLRKDFDIENGTRAQVYAGNGFIVLKPITGKYIKSLRGSLKGTKAMEVFMAERRRERACDMAIKILDSWALMALFNDEPAADEVEMLLQKASAGTHRLLMCIVNWGEIYCSVIRGASAEMADQKEKEIAAMPIEIVPVDADLHLAQQAAIFKAAHKISYADAFAAALAKIRKAELVTGDREFKTLEGEVKITWLANTR